MTSLNNCNGIKIVENEINSWLLSRPNSSEDFLNEYLIGNLKFHLNNIEVVEYNKRVEGGKTGADFLLIVSDGKRKTGYLFQAKKIKDKSDQNYKGIDQNGGKQIQLLECFSKYKGFMPAYLFYSKTRTLPKSCGSGYSSSILISKYSSIKDLYSKAKKSKPKVITKDDIIKISNSIHCLFCCQNLIELNESFNLFNTFLLGTDLDYTKSNLDIDISIFTQPNDNQDMNDSWFEKYLKDENTGYVVPYAVYYRIIKQSSVD